MFEPEALDGHLEVLVVAAVERADQLLLQLMDVEAARVDHQVGGAAHGLQQCPFQVDGLHQSGGLVVQRMSTT